MVQLAEFNFEVCYKLGKQNANADVLSRLPSSGEPEREDTEKDFLVIGDDEVRACLWPHKKNKEERLEVRPALQAVVRGEIAGYGWDKIWEQQQQDLEI